MDSKLRWWFFSYGFPFDVGIKGTLYYHPKDYIKNEKFRKRFKKAIKDILSNPDKPDSHVLETITGRGTLYQIIHKQEAIRRVKALISELKHNDTVIKEILKTAKKNLKHPEKRSVPTNRFRLSAMELLVTNRYLDERDLFYEMAEALMGKISSRNDQLNAWESSPQVTEKWFIEDGQKEAFKTVAETFMKEIVAIQKKLEVSC